MEINGHEFDIGDSVQFNSINNYDTNLWQGVVEAFASYEVAKTYTDVHAYHQNVLRSAREQFETGGGSYLEASDLSYIIIKCIDNVVRAFAVEWISATTFVVVDAGGNALIKIYGISTSSIPDILNLLKDHGYVSRQITE